ncbi:hypothetical protein JCM18899A_13140 [Nocardioides sp. AN3]
MNGTLKASVAVAGALLLLLGPAGASGPRPDQSSPRLDLTASAQPSAALPHDADHATQISSTTRRTVRAHATALASATCDGCRGEATTLQILYVGHATRVTVDNAAVAWSQCVTCGGTAVSVQVVVLLGGRQIRAQNRALATNASCEKCATAALAVQLVVVSPHRTRLSKRAIRQLRDWVAHQSTALRAVSATVPLSRRRAVARDQVRDAGTVAFVVNSDLDSRTRTVKVQQADGR